MKIHFCVCLPGSNDDKFVLHLCELLFKELQQQQQETRSHLIKSYCSISPPLGEFLKIYESPRIEPKAFISLTSFGKLPFPRKVYVDTSKGIESWQKTRGGN